MKVLFSALHHAYFRNFESVVVELVARGHRVHLAAEEAEDLGGRELARRLAAQHPGVVTWDFVPAPEGEPWFDAARRMREGLDYVRALEPRYAQVPKLRLRSVERAPRVVRWVAGVPGLGWRVARAGLMRAERLLPASEAMRAYLEAHAPDVLLLASLTYSRSRQLDQLKAARAIGVPVAAAIMSWDHLSSKALLHVAPDRVFVWNEVQRDEAVGMHGLPADRVVVTGAQCYDQWFTRQPSRDRESFCREMGLDPARPFVLWVHSAFSPQIDPPEPDLVLRWLAALRRHPALGDVGVLVRPHPERVREWDGVRFDGLGRVAFRGANPIDLESKDDYFDALYHAAAVVGLATSAFLEAAIVGRPVLALTPPEYEMHQGSMAHFRYLTEVGGGVLETSPDIAGHLPQLAAAVARSGAGRDERNRRFLGAFVRPAGLDEAATPVLAGAIEALAGEGARPDPPLGRPAWLSRVVAGAATRARHGLGAWLLRDRRDDARVASLREKGRLTDERTRTRHAYRAGKVREADRARRRDARARRRKVVVGRLRRGRHHVLVAARRALAAVGLRREGISDAGKH